MWSDDEGEEDYNEGSGSGYESYEEEFKPKATPKSATPKAKKPKG